MLAGRQTKAVELGYLQTREVVSILVTLGMCTAINMMCEAQT